MIQAVFSPTGGTQAVADAIAGSMPMQKVDLCGEVEAQAVGVPVLAVLPVYGGRLPEIAVERLRHLKGQGQAAVAVVVYGNRAYEDTLVQMEDYAQNAGFQVIAAISAVAEHSIIHEYAAGRPNLDDCNELAEFGDRILEKATSDPLSKPSVPGNRPYKKSGTGMVPKADSSCTSCGLCAQKRPAGAISANTPGTTDKSKCISCMRCVSICPVQARKVSSLMTTIAAAAIKKACSVEKANELFL